IKVHSSQELKTDLDENYIGFEINPVVVKASNYEIRRSDLNDVASGACLRVLKISKTELSLLFCPLFLRGNHWALLLFEVKSKLIKYFDWICSIDSCVVTKICSTLGKYAIKLNGKISSETSYPKQQSNGTDCGVFTLPFFIENNDLVNFVIKPTRVCLYRNYKNSNDVKTSETLIDLFLHNSDFVDETNSIECPFSDHNFVIAKLSIIKQSAIRKKIICRDLCFENLKRISSLVDEIEQKELKNFMTIDEKFKRSLQDEDKEIFEYFKSKFKQINDEKLSF
ncbi:unnamed protein product, partial [Brachionus calyciflorus]